MDIRFEVGLDDLLSYCKDKIIKNDDDILAIGRKLMFEKTGEDLWFYFDSRREKGVGVHRNPKPLGVVKIHPEDMIMFRNVTQYKELIEPVDVTDVGGTNAAMKRYAIERFGKPVPVWFDSVSTYWFMAKTN
jgi:hypothetical protein